MSTNPTNNPTQPSNPTNPPSNPTQPTLNPPPPSSSNQANLAETKEPNEKNEKNAVPAEIANLVEVNSQPNIYHLTVVYQTEEIHKVFGKNEEEARHAFECGDGILIDSNINNDMEIESIELVEDLTSQEVAEVGEVAEVDDIVFDCNHCGRGIIRNSRDHDACVSNDDGEIWWCEDCINFQEVAKDLTV